MILNCIFKGSKHQLQVLHRYKPLDKEEPTHTYFVINNQQNVPFSNYGIDSKYDYYYRWIVTDTEEDDEGNFFNYTDLFCLEIPQELKQLKNQNFESFISKLAEIPDKHFKYIACFSKPKSIKDLFALGDNIKLLDYN